MLAGGEVTLPPADDEQARQAAGGRQLLQVRGLVRGQLGVVPDDDEAVLQVVHRAFGTRLLRQRVEAVGVTQRHRVVAAVARRDRWGGPPGVAVLLLAVVDRCGDVQSGLRDRVVVHALATRRRLGFGRGGLVAGLLLL